MTCAVAVQDAAVKDRVMDVYVKLSNTEGLAMMKLGLERWAQRVRSMAAKDKRKATVRTAAAKMINGMQGATVEAAFGSWKRVMARAKAKTDVRNVAAKWQLGEDKGILFSVIRAWQSAWSKFKQGKRQSMAVQSAMMHFLGEQDQADMMTSFLAWHRRLITKKVGYEADMSIKSLCADMEEKIHNATKEAKRMKVVAHNNMNMVLKKWLCGDQKGMLSSVIQLWRTYTKATKTRNRAHAGIELQISKWAEGDEKGLFHETFSKWHKYVAQICGARREKDQVEKAEAMWKGRLEVLQKNCDDELDGLKSEAERAKEHIHLTVDSVLKNWMLGDVKGLLLSCFASVANMLKEKKAHLKRKQGVNDGVMRYLLGEQYGSMKMCFSAWTALSKSGAREKFEAIRAAEQQAKWEERQVQWMQNHKKGVYRTRVDLIMRQRVLGVKGFCMGLLRDWRLIVTAARYEESQSKSVQMVINRFIMGETKGIEKTIVSSWMTWTKLNHDRRLAREWQEKKQFMLLEKYFRGASIDRTFRYWVAIIKERKDAEVKKARKAVNDDIERMIDLEDTKRDAMTAKALLAMGCKDKKVLKGEVFLAWKLGWQSGQFESAYHRASKYMANKLLNKDAWKNAQVLKEFCWAHWYAHILRKREEEKKADLLAQRFHTPTDELKMRAAELQKKLEEISEQVDLAAAELRSVLDKKLCQTDNLTDAYHQNMVDYERTHPALRGLMPDPRAGEAGL